MHRLLLAITLAFSPACFDSDELPPDTSAGSETGEGLRWGEHDPSCQPGGLWCPCAKLERCADGALCDAAGLCVPECELDDAGSCESP
jgi:hypothetical protein